MVVDGHAKQLAVVDRRSSSVEGGPVGSRLQLHRRAPDLPAGFNVEREGPPAVDRVHDAVVNRRCCQLTLIVHEAGAPDWRQPLDIGGIDLLERTEAFPVVAHAVSGDVFRVLAVVNQLLRRLGQSQLGPETEQRRTQQKFLHVRPFPASPTRSMRRGAYFIFEKSNGSMNTETTCVVSAPFTSDAVLAFTHSGSLRNSSQLCFAVSRSLCDST